MNLTLIINTYFVKKNIHKAPTLKRLKENRLKTPHYCFIPKAKPNRIYFKIYLQKFKTTFIKLHGPKNFVNVISCLRLS